MRSIRVYTPQPLSVNQTIKLEVQASRHLIKVLRLKAGSRLVLFNGDGAEYSATLLDQAVGGAGLAVASTSAPLRESPLTINLAICLSRGDRMDHIIQKSTELGVASITPLFSARTEVKLNEQRQLRKGEHWLGIAVSACEQCGRNRLPSIAPVAKLEHWMSTCGDEYKLVLDHRAQRSLGEMEKPTSLTLLIGPEGGLSETEMAAADRFGFTPIALGPRVMRTETAPTAVIAILQHIWGDLN